MRTARSVFVASLFCAVGLIGCSKKNDYPAEVVTNFMNSCMSSGGSADSCSCTLNKVQAKFTFAEFTALEQQIVAGNAEATQKIVSLGESCR